MIEVKAQYTNFIKQTKTYKSDYFVYLNIEVKGHAQHAGYVNNTRVCAGISACCLGIIRLLDEDDFHYEYSNGYFHVWTNKHVTRTNVTWLDKESVYALNTLVCQLFEIYNNYSTAFKCFELNELKETCDENRTKQHTKPFRRRKRKMGLYSRLESPDFEENE